MQKPERIVTHYAHMWPREFFDATDGKPPRLLIWDVEELRTSGEYILYRDDQPYYVGKAKNHLYSRLHDHSNKSTDRYFNFWNFFSFFVVLNPAHVDEVEGILIASMPTANSAVPRIRRVLVPPKLSRILRLKRRRDIMGNLANDARFPLSHRAGCCCWR